MVPLDLCLLPLHSTGVKSHGCWSLHRRREYCTIKVGNPQTLEKNYLIKTTQTSGTTTTRVNYTEYVPSYWSAIRSNFIKVNKDLELREPIFSFPHRFFYTGHSERSGPRKNTVRLRKKRLRLRKGVTVETTSSVGTSTRTSVDGS